MIRASCASKELLGMYPAKVLKSVGAAMSSIVSRNVHTTTVAVLVIADAILAMKKRDRLAQ